MRENLFFHKKDVNLVGDFNIELLNCNIAKNTSDYGNIVYSGNIWSGNIATSISDHLSQFTLIYDENVFSNHKILNKGAKILFSFWERGLNGMKFLHCLKKNRICRLNLFSLQLIGSLTNISLKKPSLKQNIEKN